MYIENHLSGDDMQRAHDNSPKPPPPKLLAGSYLSLLEAINIFTQESVHQVTTTLLNLSAREQAILGLYYRSIGFCRSVIELKSVVHQQRLTSAERSVIELYVDMELIHRNAILNGVEKFEAFTGVQKLKAARRMDTFFIENPDLDSVPSRATVHREFIQNNVSNIETTVEQLWGKGAKPVHWSGLDLVNRSKKLDKDIEYLVIKDYDRSNFAVHTGVAGILNLSPLNFEAMCAFALNIIGDCLLAELHILGKELKLADAIPNYTTILEELDKVQVYAFADKTLQALGSLSGTRQSSASDAGPRTGGAAWCSPAEDRQCCTRAGTCRSRYRSDRFQCRQGCRRAPQGSRRSVSVRRPSISSSQFHDWERRHRTQGWSGLGSIDALLRTRIRRGLLERRECARAGVGAVST